MYTCIVYHGAIYCPLSILVLTVSMTKQTMLPKNNIFSKSVMSKNYSLIVMTCFSISCAIYILKGKACDQNLNSNSISKVPL